MTAAPSSAHAERPTTEDEAARLLKAAGAEGRRVRPAGGGTKLDWGHPVEDPDIELSLAGLDAITEHNEGDLTAVLEAGVPLGRAQEKFAAAGQMMALDPWLGTDDAATIGGIMAAGDSGPLRHRYGGPRDLVIGMTAALSDGTLAHSGGKVIKNVAGYDLAKLFTGAFGTLGVILSVSVRLHPRAPSTATALGTSDDLDAVARAASSMAHARMEMESLDVRLEEGRGSVLARFGGTTAARQAEAAMERLGAEGLEATVHEDDDALWEAQRAGQRSADGAVVRVSGVQTALREVFAVAERLGASVVGRAGLGLSWVRLEQGDLVGGVEEIRRALEPHPCVVLDAPREVRAAVDPWGPTDPGALNLMRRTKARFDPQGVCRPGVFVGGI